MRAKTGKRVMAITLGVMMLFGNGGVFSKAAAGGILTNPEEEGEKEVLVFSEDFETPSLDLLKWNDFHRGAAFLGSPHIVGADVFAYHPENVTVPGDGYCHIRAEKRQVTVGEKTVAYTSGMIQTQGKFYQKGGRFEARIKLPSAQGCIPAFWLMPNKIEEDFIGLGGACAEIDVMEHTAAMADYIENNVHWGGYGENHMQWGAKKAPVADPLDWHVYAVDWTPPGENGAGGSYRFYIDGVLKNTYMGEGVSSGNQMLILSMALGDWGGTIEEDALPAEMLVDWCRVYQKERDIVSFPEDGYLTNFNTEQGWEVNTGFEDGAQKEGWTFQTQRGSGNIKVVQGEEENNYLNFTTGSAHTGWPSAQFDFIQTDKRFINLEFQTYFEPGHTAGYTFGVLWNDWQGGWTDLLEIAPEGVTEKITGGNETVAPSLEPGEPYTFNIVYDNGAGETGEKKLYIYLNNVYQAVVRVPESYAYRRKLYGLRFHMGSKQYHANFRLDQVSVNQSDAPVFVAVGQELNQYTTRISAVNFSAENMPVAVFHGQYYENQLIALQLSRYRVDPGTIMVRESPWEEGRQDARRKVFVWEDTRQMKPYAPARMVRN